MGTAIKHPVPWVSECPDVKNYKWRLNPVCHRMLYSCTHMATVGFKGLITERHTKATYCNIHNITTVLMTLTVCACAWCSGHNSWANMNSKTAVNLAYLLRRYIRSCILTVAVALSQYFACRKWRAHFRLPFRLTRALQRFKDDRQRFCTF